MAKTITINDDFKPVSPAVITNSHPLIKKDSDPNDSSKNEPAALLQAAPKLLEPAEKTIADIAEVKPKIEAPAEQKAEKQTPPSAEEVEEAEAAEQAEHEAKVQKLIDDKQYQLPINALEKRRSRRFVGIGILLSLILIVAWADVALDAGLIHLGSVKPLTHFFSN